MSKEKKEAIETLEAFEPDDLVECALYRRSIIIIKNYINKQDKVIDLMAKEILLLDTLKSKFEYDHARIWETEKGIIEYFYKKVEEEE